MRVKEREQLLYLLNTPDLVLGAGGSQGFYPLLNIYLVIGVVEYLKYFSYLSVRIILLHLC